MAWTQADVDAKQAEIATMKKAIAYGDKSVSNFDLEDQLKLLDRMQAEVAGEGATGRTTYAVPRRD